jgi:amidase
MSSTAAQRPTLNTLSAVEIARGVAAGAFTCEDVTRACLARIEEREKITRAWTNFDAGKALAQARALDRSPSKGALRGVPVGVKDVLDTFDLPTEMGSPIYRGHRPADDAAAVALARSADAMILGKTVTCEFAGQTPGATTNPHNPAHTPGGSSSGSAAAVADFMVPLAFGTQTGGSVLRPASFCGIVGYKPTFNTINRFGVKPASEALDTVGLIARSLDDVILFRAALLGLSAASLAARKPRIGFCPTYLWDETSAESKAAVEEAVRTLRAAGVEVVDISLPSHFAEMRAAHRVIDGRDRAMAMAYEWTHHREGLSPALRERLQEGRDTAHADYIVALRTGERCRAEMDAVFGDCDVLLAPAAKGEAPKGLEQTGDPAWQAFWTLLHVPALTLPTAKGPNGLPVGIQMVGRRYDDERLLASAKYVWEALTAKRA